METLKKFLSRKFLVAVASLVVVSTGILRPDDEARVQELSNTIIEAILMLAPVVYILMEGLRDKEVAKNGGTK